MTSTSAGEMQLEQAIYGSQEGGGYRFLARSPGWSEAWLAEAERLCTGFGERPADVACPACVFARPFGADHVAIVQVADQGYDDAGRPGKLGFYLLILPRRLYQELEGDPFFIAERFPPPWEARGDMSAPYWTGEGPPARTVERLQKTLNVSYSATLLGGVQILLDGGRIVFERSSPDAAILRSLWALLPTSERATLWPASFAFGNAHRFDALVVPRAAGPDFDQYLSEEKLGDYPEGRYECNLQSAIETGDQREIDALLHHNRSRSLRLVVLLLAIVIVLSLGVAVLLPGPTAPRPSIRTEKSAPVLDLPAANECPALDGHQRQQLLVGLQALAARFQLDLPADSSEEALTRDLALLDKRLGTPTPGREVGPLAPFGPVSRQLRVLLWKHGVAAYSDRRLNTTELLERLDERLRQRPQYMERSGE